MAIEVPVGEEINPKPFIFSSNQASGEPRPFVYQRMQPNPNRIRTLLNIMAGLITIEVATLAFIETFDRLNSVTHPQQEHVSPLTVVSPAIPWHSPRPPMQTPSEATDKLKAFENSIGSNIPTIEQLREQHLPLVARFYEAVYPDGLGASDVISRARYVRVDPDSSDALLIDKLREDYPQDHYSFDEASKIIQKAKLNPGWTDELEGHRDRIFLSYVQPSQKVTPMTWFRSTLSHEIFHAEVYPGKKNASVEFLTGFAEALKPQGKYLSVYSEGGFRVVSILDNTQLTPHYMFDELVTDYLGLRLNNDRGLTYMTSYGFANSAYVNLMAITGTDHSQLRYWHRASATEDMLLNLTQRLPDVTFKNSTELFEIGSANILLRDWNKRLEQ